MAERSPNYPAVGLREALELTRKLYKEEKRTPASAAVVVGAWGYSGVNGAARSRLSAVRKYGLVAKSGSAFRITNRGLSLILHEEGTSEFLAAAREAALAPELFKALHAGFSEASEKNLKNHLQLNLNFTESGARFVAKAFRETLELAKLTGAAYDEPETPEDVDEEEPAPKPTLGDLIRERQSAWDAKDKEVGKVYSWPLSRGVMAEVRLSGGDVRPQHLEMLRQYLDLAKTALEADDVSMPMAKGWENYRDGVVSEPFQLDVASEDAPAEV